jgi:Protein of unknown function (DUF2806)
VRAGGQGYIHGREDFGDGALGLADNPTPPAGSLVSFRDILGVGQAVNSFVGAIEKGVGALWRPNQMRREGKAQRDETEEWLKLSDRYGLSNSAIEASISERGFARLLMDGTRHQNNREEIADVAVEEFRMLPDFQATEFEEIISDDWLEQFWQVAERFSDKDMQTLFARILATATKRNRPYSPRLLSFLQMMDKTEMDAILQIAPFVFSHNGIDNKYETVLIHSWGREEKLYSDKLYEFIGNHRADILSPLGVFVSSGWAHSLFLTDNNNQFNLEFNGLTITAKARGEITDAYREVNYWNLGAGQKVTQLGSQLFSLCAPSNKTWEYVNLLSLQLTSMGFDVEKIVKSDTFI